MSPPYQDPDLRQTQKTSNAGFAIIPFVDENGSVSIVCMDCTAKWKVAGDRNVATDRIWIQLPGGSCIEGETVENGTKREVAAEISLEARPLSVKKMTLIYRTVRPGDKSKGGGQHIMSFFLMELTEQPQYRQGSKTEADGDVLGPPQEQDIAWIIGLPAGSQKDTEKDMARAFVKPRHRDAAVNALHWLVKNHPNSAKIRLMYGGLLARTQEVVSNAEFRPFFK